MNAYMFDMLHDKEAYSFSLPQSLQYKYVLPLCRYVIIYKTSYFKVTFLKFA